MLLLITIYHYLNLGLQNRPKSLYIFINPFGGKGKATEIYHKYVNFLYFIIIKDFINKIYCWLNL